MSVRVNTLSDEEIRSIGDAFGHYTYEAGESGLLCLGKSREAISDYICGYTRMAIMERSLYSTSDDHEAFISFKRSDVKSDTKAGMEVLKTIPGAVDIKNTLSLLKGFSKSGKSYTAILSKLKIPYIYVGMVAIPETYQGKGYMRKVLEIAFEEGRKHALPVVLDTDGELKKDKYEHLGMKCVVTEKLTDKTTIYGLVYEPDNLPEIWRSETVLEDYKILSEKNKDVWDRFAPVYKFFVTGTPGNKQVYDTIYRRIKKVVKGKDVLELGTGPGVIAKQVADETKSIIATDFSDKMLAEARRGLVSSKLRFENADATNLRFEDNSFDVVVIANTLHVIPDREKVLDEIKRVLRPRGILIAPNFVHAVDSKKGKISSKALELAGVSFAAKWDEDGYRSFLEDNGFKVINSKVLNGAIPLMYTESIIG